MGKNKALWSLASLILAVICIFAVIKAESGFSLKVFIENLKDASAAGLVTAFVCMLGFIYFEGQAIRSILNGLGYGRTMKEGMVYSAADIYVSAITPSASGGQPASALFMIMDGIPIAVTTVVLLLNLIMYTLSIMIVGVLCILMKPVVFTHFNLFSKTLIVIGYMILIGLGTLFYLLLRKKTIFQNLCTGLFRILTKIRFFRRPEKVLEKMDKVLGEYELCSQMVASKGRVLLKAFIYNFLQRVSQISVTMVAFLAIGGDSARAFDIWATQSMVAIGSNCIPIPGAIGAADYLMLDGFSGVVSGLNITHLELLSRGISFYSCVLISGLIVITSYAIHLWRGKNDRNL
ncbi:MAG: lysylphosphatidylglycerol synthase transmembrane domain-containing protein [Eubacteriaceae bacterium]|nr:lysylphosphatidylglycerol synthase transmembrane domain-containing protein [Eubacteriaceae bacterium]